MIWLAIAVLVVCFIGVLITMSTGRTHRHGLEVYLAQQRMRDIKHQTVREMHDAEARYRQQHGGDDVIEGTAVEGD